MKRGSSGGSQKSKPSGGKRASGFSGGDKRTARKSSSKRAGGRAIERAPAGYRFDRATSSLYVPHSAQSPVKPNKPRDGLREVKKQSDETLDELITTLTGAYEISDIKLVASFSADGKFLGFGVGGAALKPWVEADSDAAVLQCKTM